MWVEIQNPEESLRPWKSRHSNAFSLRTAAPSNCAHRHSCGSTTNSERMALATEASAQTKQSYEKLCAKLKDISALHGISGLLGWDEMVMMPSGAAGSRGAQKAALAGVLYDKETDPELGQLLKALTEQQEGLDQWEKANIRDAHKAYVKATAVPKDLAQRIARHETDAYHAWVEARKSSDFSKFAPALQLWVELSKEKAACINPAAPAYDVLLDSFETGMTSARLDKIFAEVREGLVPLIAAIQQNIGQVDDAWIKGTYDTTTQADLCRQVALDIGFSLEQGRLDVSVHPFTGGSHPTDVRMTTRFKEDDLTEGLTGAVHETGHALYEQGRNLTYDGLPVNVAQSTGIHESQSLLWERMVALSPAFSRYLRPKLAALFPEKFGGAVTSDELWHALNVVRPSLIRVEADEATYPLHIILRHELETGLLNGSIQVEDLPRLWNEKMEAYLGVKPPSDAQGVLQDIHWSMGCFGYFATYSLGAMYATQIFNQAHSEIPDLEEHIAQGEFKPLKAWLNEKIHRVGSLHGSGDKLVTAVTGAPLDPQVFLAYLKTKYSTLYKLQGL